MCDVPVGPTQNYDDETLGRWKPHPTLAVVVRVLISALPPVLSLSFGLAAAHWLPPERLGLNRWVWLVGEIGCAWALLWVTRRAARQLLPLSTLLSLGLFFPDQVPSRFRMALRAHSTKALQDRVEQLLAQGVDLQGEELYATTLLGLIGELRTHDRLTRGHSERVQAYAGMIGKELRLSEEDTAKLRWAALLHDVGKLHVPGAILNKTTRPSEREWAVLSTHPQHGVELAQPLRQWLGPWLDAIGQHHEKWNGTGYPAGLRGDAISYGARIVAVADTFDVITSARSYKKPMTAAAARAELARCAGTQFDPTVVRAFLAIGIGRLRLTAGPLSALASFPGIPAAPLSNLANLGSAASGMVAITVASAVVGLSPAAPPVTPQAHEYLAPAAGSAGHPHSSGSRRPAPSPTGAAPGGIAPTSSPASPAALPGTAAPTPHEAPTTAPAVEAPTTPTSTTTVTTAAPRTTGSTNAPRPAAPPTTAPTTARSSTATTAAAPSTTAAAAKTSCAKAQAGATFLPGADLNGCDLRGKHLSGFYAGAKLTGADLRGATLDRLNLAGAVLNNAKLRGARVSSTSFDDAHMVAADLSGATFSRVTFRDATLANATLEGASLAGADLSSADLSGAKAASTRFTGARLSRTVLRKADLSRASFAAATGTPSSVSGATWSSTTCPNGVTRSTSCF
jgi:putative nucleotidyltransferase with HDIG domain